MLGEIDDAPAALTVMFIVDVAVFVPSVALIVNAVVFNVVEGVPESTPVAESKVIPFGSAVEFAPVIV